MSSNTSVIFDGQLSIQDNRGSLVNILAWFLLIASSLTVFTRIATKWLVSRKFNLDDGMILLSLVSSAYSNQGSHMLICSHLALVRRSRHASRFTMGLDNTSRVYQLNKSYLSKRHVS
jgi:hypothetical protein